MEFCGMGLTKAYSRWFSNSPSARNSTKGNLAEVSRGAEEKRRPTEQAVSGLERNSDIARLKERLKETGYYNSMRLMLVAMIFIVINQFVINQYVYMVAVLAMLGAILYIPFLRIEWDDKFYKEQQKKDKGK